MDLSWYSILVQTVLIAVKCIENNQRFIFLLMCLKKPQGYQSVTCVSRTIKLQKKYSVDLYML